MYLDSLPPRFVPFGKIILRTNKLIDTTALFSINGVIPLLIGKGPPPRIWLSLPTSADARQWAPVVKENFSSHPDITVDAFGRRVLIKASEIPMLHVLQNESDDLAFLSLNLRPVGLRVFIGEDNKLHVMGSTLAGNTFKNLRVAIALETQSQSFVPLG